MLVTRSGMEASRFSPRLRSFMKPEMILRWLKDACHMAWLSVRVRVSGQVQG